MVQTRVRQTHERSTNQGRRRVTMLPLRHTTCYNIYNYNGLHNNNTAKRLMVHRMASKRTLTKKMKNYIGNY